MVYESSTPLRVTSEGYYNCAEIIGRLDVRGMPPLTFMYHAPRICEASQILTDIGMKVLKSIFQFKFITATAGARSVCLGNVSFSILRCLDPEDTYCI